MPGSKSIPNRRELSISRYRCNWCGREFEGWGILSFSHFCSLECSSAGLYYENICIMSVTLFVTIGSFVTFLVAATGGQFATFSPMILLVFLVFLIISLYAMYKVRLGKKVRQRNKRTQQGVSRINQEDELTKRHHQILDFFETKSTDTEVNIQQIYNHMRKLNSMNSHTKIAVRELVLGGYLREIDRETYGIGQRFREKKYRN